MKKVENQTAGERASGQNPQIKKPNRQKTVGQHCKTRLENRTTQAPIFGDITKKKGCDNIFVTAFWWELVDSNHRSIKQQIYSLSPLATREHAHIQFCSPWIACIYYHPDGSLSTSFAEFLDFCVESKNTKAKAAQKSTFLSGFLELVTGVEPATH